MSIERESTGGGAVLVDPLGGLMLDPPNELKFKGPFEDFVSVSLMIKNPTEKRIAFKIKTTAPKRYCVKPNSGVLDPSQSMKVNVLLQPFNYDPNEKNKHKFMVQYMYLNQEEMQMGVNDILNIWKDLPANRLLDLKLKCIFEQTETGQTRAVDQQQKVDNVGTPSVSSSSSNTAVTNSATIRNANNNNSNSLSNQQSSPSPVQSNKATRQTDDYQTASSTDFDSTRSSQVGSQLNSTVVNNTNSNTTSSSTTASRLDKNDNTLNELKLLRNENDKLKKEIERLKEEDARLRKIALQAPSSSASHLKPSGNAEVLAELLNNRSTIIIISLLAIIIYLILFR